MAVCLEHRVDSAGKCKAPLQSPLTGNRSIRLDAAGDKEPARGEEASQVAGVTHVENVGGDHPHGQLFQVTRTHEAYYASRYSKGSHAAVERACQQRHQAIGPSPTSV